jgi:hypothetical protein
LQDALGRAAISEGLVVETETVEDHVLCERE